MARKRIFEHRHQALASRTRFLARVARFSIASAGLVAFALAIGSLGYRWIGGLEWVDAFLNAAMILTGMGPVDRMQTPGGKLFAAGYALFSGLAFVTIVAVLFAPLVHRFLHALHLDAHDEPQQ